MTNKMNIKHLAIALLAAITLGACTQHTSTTQTTDYASLVNPFVGTDGPGNTYPGASLPFGMVQVSPDNGIPGWDRISGYFYPDSTISGFSQTHLTGTGAGDLYDLPLMPVTHPYKRFGKLNPKTPDAPYSLFLHSEEHAEAGYYQVRLKDYDINVELTATERCAFHRYTFPEAEKASIFLDLKRQLNWDYTLDSKIRIINNQEIEGYRHSKGWADKQQLFYVARFSKPFINAKTDTSSITKPFRKDWGGTGFISRFDFKTEKGEQIMVQIAISSVSIDGARRNLDAELNSWDFDQVRASAKDKWNRELSKIEIKAQDDNQQRLFYTMMYQSMLAPTLFSDVDGQYYGPDHKIHKTQGWNNYSTLSLWDTFRAAHPLYTITQPDRVNDMVKSMLAFYQQHGVLPVWPLAGNVTGMMIGYHAVPVIVDAYLKGIGNFDHNLALEACIASASANIEGQEHYRKYGYIPYEKEHESVSKTLEYAYDDWCIAQMAKKMGKPKIAKEYEQRAQFYRNIYDPITRFMRPKDSKGKWIPNFVGKQYTTHYCESNAWHYHFFVPQDIKGLIDIMGGNQPFNTKLDSTFSYSPTANDKLPIFSTGMIGQYAHGNEPSHHVAYLYNYSGKPWKAQQMVNKITTTQYKNEPYGHCGNEDCGQMSSWYIFSSLGFYPVNPANQIYVIGSPIVKSATIHLDNGKQFSIEASNLTKENVYIQRVMLNGKEYSKNYITHNDIINGGTISFTMGSKPNKERGTQPSDIPPYIAQ